MQPPAKIGEKYPGVGKGVALMLLSALAFGVMPIFIKLAYAEGVGLNTLLALRFSIAGAIMWLLWAYQHRRGARVAVTRALLLPVIAMGGLGYVGQSFSYYQAIDLIPASATALLLYTYPILVTVLAWLLLKERLTLRKALALSVAMVGALMVLGVVSLSGGQSYNFGALNPQGVAWALGAALIYSLYIIAGARFTRDLPPIYSSAVIISSAALVYLLWGLAAGGLYLGLTPYGWLWVCGIAFVSTVLAIALFFAGLPLVGASRAAIISTVEPAVTVVLAHFALQEALALEQLLGGTLILVSVLMVQQRGT